MSQHELFEHRTYVADDRRTSAYRAALRDVVRPGDRVLDLGSGTGILGLLAHEAGAGTVLAVEHGEIVSLARDVARANGCERVEHLQVMSTELTLDEPVDVVVCDQIGGLVHDAGVLRYFADARRRLLADGGRLVPESFSIFLAPVTYPAGREAVDFWSSRPGGFDMSAARRLAANTEWQYRDVSTAMALAPGARLASFASHDDGPVQADAAFDIAQDGRLDGFLGWFEARLSPSVTLTNDPWAADRFDRWCNFYPVDPGPQVAAGTRVTVRLDVRPRLNLVSWDTRVQSEGEAPQRFRHSTYAGSFVTRSTLERRAAEAAPVTDTGRSATVRAVLDLVDGTRTVDDIVTALVGHVGPDFPTEARLRAFVGETVALLRAPDVQPAGPAGESPTGSSS